MRDRTLSIYQIKNNSTTTSISTENLILPNKELSSPSLFLPPDLTFHNNFNGKPLKSQRINPLQHQFLYLYQIMVHYLLMLNTDQIFITL